jgi:arylformamidase
VSSATPAYRGAMFRSEHWRGLSAEERQREVSPSSQVPSLEPYLAAYGSASAAVRAITPPSVHAYGDHPDETLDLWVPAGRGPFPLHVFVHGGYWRALSKLDASFPAPAYLAAGCAFAALDYSLAPGASLDHIVDQVRRAVRWVGEHAALVGCDPARVTWSGHSAGAHLVAMALADTASAPFVAGAVLVSGVYDLVPLLGTTINDDARLDAEAAERLSPINHVPHLHLPLVVIHGEADTDHFRRQGLVYAAAWAEAGNRPPVVQEIVGRNHFDVIVGLPPRWW